MTQRYEILMVNSATTDELSVEVWADDFLVLELLRQDDTTMVKLGPWLPAPHDSFNRIIPFAAFKSNLEEAIRRMEELYPPDGAT